MPGIELVVQGDDFGMCHAVNEGVVKAFTEGIVTQASTMAPCPWFEEAAELARRHDIPTGLHQTLTCEWDYLRWGPLTHGPTLASADGTFHRTVADAQAHGNDDEATEELLAQAARATAAGMTLRYLDVHMGIINPAAYEAVSHRLGVPFLYPGLSTSMMFASITMVSSAGGDDKKGWLLHKLGRLGPGRHLMVTHPALPGQELSAITGPHSGPVQWAQEYRATDLAVLTDPEVRDAIDRLGIELTTAA